MDRDSKVLVGLLIVVVGVVLVVAIIGYAAVQSQEVSFTAECDFGDWENVSVNSSFPLEMYPDKASCKVTSKAPYAIMKFRGGL